MFRFPILATLLIAAGPAFALDPIPGTETDHEALRQMKAALIAAVNAQDFEALGGLLNTPFSTTVITQDQFTSIQDGESYFEQLFSRPMLKMQKISIEAEADALSTIYSGTFAITTGSSVETYQLADGRSFMMPARWTAISVQDADGWKLAAFHEGTNFLDNPVFNAVSGNTTRIGAIAGVIGLLAGVLGGWFIGRRGRRSA